VCFFRDLAFGIFSNAYLQSAFWEKDADFNLRVLVGGINQHHKVRITLLRLS
jgi:hypothetical protein